MLNNIIIGQEGESLAVNHLEKKGYKILSRNWRYKHLEIDIIAQFKNEIIFIEVKRRSGTYIEQPFQAVNKKKQKNIIEAANAYINKFEIDLSARFDIISIISEKYDKIDHIEDAFYPLV